MKWVIPIVKVEEKRKALGASAFYAVHAPVDNRFAIRRKQSLIVGALKMIWIIPACIGLPHFNHFETVVKLLHHRFNQNEFLEVGFGSLV